MCGEPRSAGLDVYFTSNLNAFQKVETVRDAGRNMLAGRMQRNPEVDTETKPLQGAWLE